MDRLRFMLTSAWTWFTWFTNWLTKQLPFVNWRFVSKAYTL